MTFRGKISLALFFLIGLIVLFFVVVSLYAANSNFSLQSIFFADKSGSPPATKPAIGDVSVKSFPVNSHLLWVVEMRAENNVFEPPSLIVREGDVVDINLSAMDRDYEVYLPGLGVYKLVAKGQKSKIQFQAYPAGEHAFACKADCANPPHGLLVINR